MALSARLFRLAVAPAARRPMVSPNPCAARLSRPFSSGGGDAPTPPGGDAPPGAAAASAPPAGGRGGRGGGRGGDRRPPAGRGGGRGRGRGMPDRFSNRGGRPALRDGGEDAWLTTAVLQGLERETLLGDVQMNPAEPPPRADDGDRGGKADGSGALGAGWDDAAPEDDGDAPVDMTYLLRRRRQGSIVSPDEYDFVAHRHDRERPHELHARLDGHRGDRPRCDKKAGFHIVQAEHIFAGNLPALAEFVSDAGMIQKRDQSRLCAKYQRKVKRAIKRARQLGLVPFDAGFDTRNDIGFPDAAHKAAVSKTI